MSNENEGGLFSCPVMCWIIGALLGLATYLLMSGRFGAGMVVSVIAALVVLVLAAVLLGRLFCRAVVSAHGHPARHEHDIAATPEAVANVDNIGDGGLSMPPAIPEVITEVPSTAVVSKAASDESADKPATKPASKSKAKPASAATAGDKTATAKPKAPSKPKAKAAAKPAAKAAAKPAAKAATKPAAKKPAAKTATKPARPPVAKDGKPEMLTAAREGGADDLKQIKGVGPKMEVMLNKMGVYHFDQVSGWRAKEVKWVDDNLQGFKGRVSRDEWVKQAKILAKGGKTEFSKKVAKGGVYAKNKK